MGRLGFVGRIMLILMCALFAILLLAIGLNRWQRANDTRGPVLRLPRVDQAAAIVDWLQRAQPSERTAILRAVNGATLRVRVDATPPADVDGLARAPRLERRLKTYLADPALPVEAYVAAAAMDRSAMRRGLEGRLIRVVARLSTTEVLVIDAPGPRSVLAVRILGLPPGFWVGILGFSVAGLALFAALRETEPLRRLTRSVASFDGAAPGPALAERGAPDIRRLTRAVNGMQERIAALMRERSFLIGAISHDLKTYLTRLRLRSEAMADAGQRERMVRDLDAMTGLIDVSLAFARGTTVSQTRGRLDVADLVAAEVAERSALGDPIRIVDDAGDPLPIDGDPVALRRVFANVIENAVKFGGSVVEIRIGRTGGQARILVDDDGPGIAEQDRAAIFTPFYRAEGSRSRETGGTGLGLAIAKQIVEAHGGMILAADGPLGGARLDIRLPLAGQA